MASDHHTGKQTRMDKLEEHVDGKENNSGVGFASKNSDGIKPAQTSKQVRNSKGWDGKLRVDKRALSSMQDGRDGGVESERKGLDGSDGEEEEEDDDDDDDDSSVDEAVSGGGSGGGGGGASTVAMQAERDTVNRRVEVKDGEEIEADEG